MMNYLVDGTIAGKNEFGQAAKTYVFDFQIIVSAFNPVQAENRAENAAKNIYNFCRVWWYQQLPAVYPYPDFGPASRGYILTLCGVEG